MFPPHLLHREAVLRLSSANRRISVRIGQLEIAVIHRGLGRVQDDLGVVALVSAEQIVINPETCVRSSPGLVIDRFGRAFCF